MDLTVFAELNYPESIDEEYHIQKEKFFVKGTMKEDSLTFINTEIKSRAYDWFHSTMEYEENLQDEIDFLE